MEALALIEATHERNSALPPHWHAIDQNTLIIETGIGPYAAHLAIDEYMRFFSKEEISRHRWLNIGIAGAILPSSKTHRDMEGILGDLIPISSVSLLEWHPRNGFSHVERHEIIHTHHRFSGQWHLLTSPLPIRESSEVKINTPLKSENDIFLVDMEAFAIAKEARRYGISLQISKIVSDFCNEETPDRIRQSLPIYSKKIAQYVTEWS